MKGEGVKNTQNLTTWFIDDPKASFLAGDYPLFLLKRIRSDVTASRKIPRRNRAIKPPSLFGMDLRHQIDFNDAVVLLTSRYLVLCKNL